MAHDEPVGRVAARPGMTSPPSGSWNRWPPPAATSSHNQFFSVVKKARPAAPGGGAVAVGKAGPVVISSPAGPPSLKFSSPAGAPSLKLSSPAGASSLKLSSSAGAPSLKLSSPTGAPGLKLSSPAGQPSLKLSSPAGAPGLKLSSPAGASSLKTSPVRPGPSRGPISLLKAGPLRMGLVAPSSSANVARPGPPRPGPSSVASLPRPVIGPTKKVVVSSTKMGLPRPGPPVGYRPVQTAPGARPRIPSGGAARPTPDSLRPKPSASVPKPRMSWDLDLLTDGSPEDEGDFASDLEQSPAFLTGDLEPRPSRGPSLAPLGGLKTMGPFPGNARDMPPRSRGRPPKAPGEKKSKYVRKQAANGAGGHSDNVLKPKWKGAFDTHHNDLSKAKEKAQRRRKEQLVAVRMDGSVPQMVTLLPKDASDTARPVTIHSPTKDAPRPRLASPLRKLSGEHAPSRSETKPLFEHIDEDWAVIKKSLEKTAAERERTPSEAGSSVKSHSGTLTPSPTKKSDRSDELSSDEDIGNSLNAPLQNLEKLQNQMIKTLMDEGALAALKKKRRKQKEAQMFKKKKMSDYWKSKLGPGKASLPSKLKRPYTVRPLTSDNVKHMEEAIAAVLAAPTPEGSPKKRSPGGSSFKAKLKLKLLAGRSPNSAAPPPLKSQPESQPQQAPSDSQSASVPPTGQSAAMSDSPTTAVPVPPSSAAGAPAPDAAGPERAVSSEAETDPAAAARLQRVKQELAARFLSDLHEQRAQLQAAEQQRIAWEQQQHQQAAAAAAAAAQRQLAALQQPQLHSLQQPQTQQQKQVSWRPLIRVGRRRRRRAGQPRIVRLTEASYLAGTTITDADIGDDRSDDGLAPVTDPDTPLPVSMPASALKEFLDSARVSRYRRTCDLALLTVPMMPVEETSDRMVFVSERPLPPGVEQTLVPNGQLETHGLSGVPGAGWPAMYMDPSLGVAGWPAGSPAPGHGWYGSPAPVASWGGVAVSPAATTGWFGGVMSPGPDAQHWTGLPVDASGPTTPRLAVPLTVPAASPALVPTPVAEMSTPVTPAPMTSAPMTPISVTPAPMTPAPMTPASVTPVPSRNPSASAVSPSAAPTPTPEDASDVSMEEKPLQIVLPPTPSGERALTPAGSAPPTPMSVSPRVALPSAASSVRRESGGASVPGTPAAGVSPRAASATPAASALPSPLPVDPESLLFACNRCPQRLATLSEQVYHEIRLHMTDEYLFRCLGCPMMVPLAGDPSGMLNGLLDHYMKHVDGDGRLVNTDTSTDFFRCEFCPRVFEDPTAYGTHEIQCRSLTHTCATCQGRYETSDSLKWHEVDHLLSPDGKYCCDHCDSKFAKREQLLGHRRFHFKDKNVECPKCGKKFMTTGMLAMHNKWKHSQGPCRFCGRPFTSATARQAHEEHMHLKHMMHMCDVCHFRVMTATQLRVHKRTHSDDKPHRCAACDEAFVSRNLLKKHRLSRHAEPRPAAAATATEDPAPATAAAEPEPAPAEPSASQSGGESARAPDGTLTPAELRQLFDRYKATWTGPKDELTLSDLDTDEDEDEKRDIIDLQAKEELFKTKDKNSLSVWSCPVCNAFFTKLWGVRAHITLKHPGSSQRPVLHDDKDTSACSKQDFLKEIKRNAKTAKRELKMEEKRQARIAAYGDELPRRGRPRKYPMSERPVRKPYDPNEPRKRGRPRKNPDDPTASPRLGAPPPEEPPPPPKPEPKPEPPPDHVERRRWKCLTCEDQSQSYDDLVTHTYIAHPDADLPRFEVVVTYVPKPVPKAPAEPPPPKSEDAAGAENQEQHDAAILDSARVRGAEKRRAPSATKVPDGAKRRSVPTPNREGATRGRGRGGSSRGGGNSSRGGGNSSRSSITSGRSSTGRSRHSSGDARGSSSGGGDSYRKSYSNSSRRFKGEDAAPAAAAASTDDADKLYCYCQSPYDEVSEMIGCDSDDCTHEWFHFECVGIVIAPKGKWFCPDCAPKHKAK